MSYYIAAFGLVIALPALLFGAFLLSRYADAERSRGYSQILTIAATLADGIDRELSNNVTTLKVLADSTLLEDDRLEEFHARAKASLAGTGSYVLLLDLNLQQLVNTRVPFGTPLGPTADQQSSLAAIESGGPVISDVFFGKVAGKPVFNVMYPVKRDGDIRYVLILTRDSDSFASMMDLENVDPRLMVSIIDRNGIVLAQSPGGQAGLSDNALPDDLGLAVSVATGGWGTWSNSEGDEFIVVASRPALVAWSVVILTPTTVFDESADKSWYLMGIGALVLLAITILIAFLFGGYLARPMARLARDAKALGEGRAVTADDSPILEVTEVSSALQAAAAQRRDQIAQIELLMGELAHRAKNQLTVVQSMARLAARKATSIDTFQAGFLPRLDGLSRSIDVLTHQDWRGGSLRDLAAAHLDVFALEGEPRYRLTGPDIFIRPAAVERLGMALHELATNASKYGALSVPGGMVDLTWHIDETTAPSTITLAWRETGGPAFAEPTQNGFGYILVHDMMRSTLKAEVIITYPFEGLIWQMTCPVDQLIDNPGGSGLETGRQDN